MIVKKQKKEKPLTVTEFAAMGGRARAKALTKKQLSESGKKAIAARWDKKKKPAAKQPAAKRPRRRSLPD